MSATDKSRHRDESTSIHRSRKHWVPFAAAATAAVLTAGAVASSGGGAAGAATPLSQATGRFLSGSVAGQDLDVVGGIDGESAVNPGNPGPNRNSLNVELLNNAFKLPFGATGLQLQDPTTGASQVGAAGQYAKANKDGSAVGASGAVDSEGGLGVAGTDGVPTGGATLDLSKSPLLTPITSALADLKLTIGAVSARASQVAVGKTQADPSAGCANGPFTRVGDTSQAGSYRIASFGIDLTSNLLKSVGSTLDSTLTTLTPTLDTVTTALGSILGPLSQVVTVTGIPNIPTLINSLLNLSLADGAITLSLTDGSMHIDLKALLSFLHLDINDLCPNSALLPYVVQAITTGLPDVINTLISTLSLTLQNALGNLNVAVAGVPISAGNLTLLVGQLLTPLTTALGTVLNSVDTSALDPVLDLLTNSLLSIVVNGQESSGGTLTETGLQLGLLPGGATLTLPTIPGLPTGLVQANAKQALITQAAAKKAAAASAPSTTSAKFANIRSLAVAPAGNPLVQLNLAQASVGPNSTAVAPPTGSTTPGTPTTGSVPPTDVPTGVPAGMGSHGHNSVLPLTLLALGLMFAGGGVVAFRRRGILNQH